MEIIQTIILGIVQGIGEFLPISSSAHLILVPYLFGWQEHSLAFDVALHFGTLIAILFVYWKDWFNLLKGTYEQVRYKKKSTYGNLFWYMLIALIPGAIIAKLLDDKIESLFRTSTWLIIAALGVMGILIYIGDKYAEKKYKGKEVEFEKISLKQAFFIGLSQALAIIPGFSRSGTTILTSRLMGLSRKAAAKFTFMLSVPTILGITIVKVKDLIAGFNIELLIGIAVSAIVGILSIKFLLNYIKKKDFAVFAYYRLILVIIIAIKLIITH